MDKALLDVLLVFSDPDGPDAADRDMGFLIEEIEQLHVLSLAHPPAPAPPAGVRAGESVVYSSLILGLAGAPALNSLILLAQDWLARRNHGTIRIKIGDDEIEITPVNRHEKRLAMEAVEAFVTKITQNSSDA